MSAKQIQTLAQEYIKKAVETEKQLGYKPKVSHDMYVELTGRAADAFRDLTEAKEAAVATTTITEHA